MKRIVQSLINKYRLWRFKRRTTKLINVIAKKILPVLVIFIKNLKQFTDVIGEDEGDL